MRLCLKQGHKVKSAALTRCKPQAQTQHGLRHVFTPQASGMPQKGLQHKQVSNMPGRAPRMDKELRGTDGGHLFALLRISSSTTSCLIWRKLSILAIGMLPKPSKATCIAGCTVSLLQGTGTVGWQGLPLPPRTATGCSCWPCVCIKTMHYCSKKGALQEQEC